MFADAQEDLVVDYVDEEREGIEFITDVNIVDREHMGGDSQVCGVSEKGNVNNTFDPDVSSSSDDDETNNLIYKWRETKHKRRGVRGPTARFHVNDDVHLPGLNVRGGGVRGNHTHDIVSPARGGLHNRPHKGRPRGRAQVRGGHNNNLINMDGNDDIVWNWETIPHKDVDDMEENENIANLEHFPFTETEGLQVRMNNEHSIIDFVKLYLTDEVFNILVTETNRFAEQFLAAATENTRSNSYVGKWVPVTIPEMEKFLGLVILMGIIYKPSTPLYWSTDELFSTPIFSQLMTRNRFQLIEKFLHFNNNLDPSYDPLDENRDRLHKVRPILDILRRQCKSVRYPGKELSIDESLVLFKGRVKFRQYIKTKRARFGIKLYELTTSDGITLDFLVYCGKGMFYNDDEHSNMPSTERIPSVLMGPYLGKGHILFTDNYYTSPTLASFLLSNQTHLCGTIRKNRKHFPKDLAPTKLQKGESVFRKKVNGHPMIAVKYRALKDKASKQPKVVFMLSTYHDAVIKKTGKIDHVSGLDNIKPLLTMEYNRHMGGVDRVDQQLHTLKILRKSYKWYKKLVFRLFSQVILNSHKVYQKVTGNTNVTFMNFLREVVVSLVTVTENIANPMHIVDETCSRITGRHFPSIKQAAPGARDQRPTKQCKVCKARNKKTDKGKPLKTIYVCKCCPSEPGLHPDGCFEIYHTMIDFS